MVTDLNILKEEFLRIKRMGYVKSLREGYTGIGKTFEDLLGKKEDTLELPDYRGIEIKTKRSYSSAYITLFNATPQGKNNFEIKRIKEIYGYPDKIMKNYKILNNSVQANTVTLIANRYFFKLNIDRDERKVFLLIYGRNMQLIEKSSFWTFETLKEKLYRKLKYLALIKAWPKTINGEVYYKYYDIDFYELKSFDEFLDLLEMGTIRVTFKISVFRTGERIGQVHDRGTSFEIQEINLFKLFNIIKV